VTRELEQVLADHRGNAAVLRHEGHPTQADSIERVCDDVAASMRDYLDWLTEDDAQLASAWSVARLRRSFPGWQAVNMAKLVGEGRRAKRLYRHCIVPRRANEFIDYEAGRRAS
jgi:hypothetical protein